MMCGHIFPRREKIQAQTSGKVLVKKSKIPPPTITEEPKHEKFTVDHVIYKYHHKGEGYIPSLKVSYKCGLRSFDEWVFFDDGAPFRGKGRSWWMQRANCEPSEIPDNVNEDRKSTRLNSSH